MFSLLPYSTLFLILILSLSSSVSSSSPSMSIFSSVILHSSACIIIIIIGFLLKMQIFDPSSGLLKRNLLVMEPEAYSFSECALSTIKFEICYLKWWAISQFFFFLHFASVTLEFSLLSKNALNLFWPPCCVHSNLTPESRNSVCPWRAHKILVSLELGLHPVFPSSVIGHLCLDSCQSQKLRGNSNFCLFPSIHSLIVSYLFCLLNLGTLYPIISSTIFTIFIGPHCLS